MLAVRLDEAIEKALDRLAEARGSTRSAVVREAILQYLEDQEDLELAKEAKARSRGSRPLAKVRKDLGLDG